MTLSQSDHQRYLRNIILPEIGEKGQQKLLDSKVLVVGAGGLGSAILFYLSACGIGNLGIIDNDQVELSNLQRQIIHNTQDLNKLKITSAREKILALNPNINVTTYQNFADEENLHLIAQNYDLIVDASDNFYTRFTINQICHNLKKPMVYGAVKGFVGQVSVFKSYLANNPCYACFNPNFKDRNFNLPLSEKGILGAVAGNLGTLQAINAIKELLNLDESLVGKILFCDFLKNNFRKVKVTKNHSCKICCDN
ncbi:thiazole biosynthesis adenylyltransferase ThiF [Alphaproteobacteria bacterium]|nr:thiazole biosynthesis adenylyltransferase ThiF [Alphaproteobacteria bacterium]